MNLKAKAYVESQKTTAQKNLSTRQAALEAKGMNAKDVEKDPQIKKLKADIRKANQRLAAIDAQEKLIAEKQKAKADKAAAKKEAKAPAKEKAAKKADGKGEKKEKKPAGKKKGADKE